jgi:hypothetical protein
LKIGKKIIQLTKAYVWQDNWQKDWSLSFSKSYLSLY